MEYLTELLNLENEWKNIRISGEEYASALNTNHELRNRKKEEILAYRGRIMNSNLIGEEKESKLKEIKDNLNYLDEKNPIHVSANGPDSKESQDNQLLTGFLIGGLIAIFGMYVVDKVKNYLTEGLSDSILTSVYSELRGKEFKSGL